MRYILLLSMLLYIGPLKASTYYFSTNSGNDLRSAAEAQNAATPWRTLAKLNVIFVDLNPGDSILFRRDETFEGSILITKSGASNLPIVFAAYGTGAKPVISGLTDLTDWASTGNGTWESFCSSGAMINMVLINGVLKEIGRYPNSGAANKGYLTIQSSIGNSQITDTELSTSPDWTGGEVVIRKARWVLDRNLITRHSGNTIDYVSESPNTAAPKYGYFIQNHPKTLDLTGEWYYKMNDQKLGIYFSSGSPASYTIQASKTNTLVTLTNQANFVFDNISFIGANNAAFEMVNSQRVLISNCDILFSGVNAINAKNTTDITIEKVSVNHTNNVALNLDNCSNLTIRYCKIENTGIIAGMGKGDSGGYEAILLTGDNVLIEQNEINNTGYIPITFRGNLNNIRNNLINNFALVKDDGGGIYSWNNIPNALSSYGTKITANIILNGKGAPEGTDWQDYYPASGIYMDDNTANVEITGNTVANCGLYGIYLHNAHEITVSKNTLYNSRAQLVLAEDGIAAYSATRNMNIQNNIFFAKAVNYRAAEFRTDKNDISEFGILDNNFYCRPVDDNQVIFPSYQINGTYNNNGVNLDQWKALFGKDNASRKSPVSLSTADLIRFEYNATGTAKPVSLNDTYIDVYNNTYTGTVTLEPFTSVVLMKSATGDVTTPASNCPGIGSILREEWDEIPGNDISQIPLATSPAKTSQLTMLETNNSGEAFGARIRGYLCPPLSGNYTFYIAGDDQVELWLSTDESPGNKIKIASVPGWTEFHQFDKFSSQRSAPINLQAGRRYYIEALHKDGNGADHLSVAWVLPNGLTESPIPGSHLIPVTNIVSEACPGTGSLLREQWDNVIGNDVPNIPLDRTPNSSAQVNMLETASIGDYYGDRMRGFLCPPQSGAYTFFVSGDDAVELWLSMDENPANKIKIAGFLSWTEFHQFNKFPSQQSAPVSLQAGHRYYIEVLHKEGAGGDHVTVGWQLPDGITEIPIRGNRLLTYSNAAIIANAHQMLQSLELQPDTEWEVNVYPNPFKVSSKIVLNPVESGEIILEVYDLQCRKLQRFPSRTIKQHVQETFTLNAGGLSSGVYIIRLETKTKVVFQKIVLSR